MKPADTGSKRITRKERNTAMGITNENSKGAVNRTGVTRDRPCRAVSISRGMPIEPVSVRPIQGSKIAAKAHHPRAAAPAPCMPSAATSCRLSKTSRRSQTRRPAPAPPATASASPPGAAWGGRKPGLRQTAKPAKASIALTCVAERPVQPGQPIRPALSGLRLQDSTRMPCREVASSSNSRDGKMAWPCQTESSARPPNTTA